MTISITSLTPTKNAIDIPVASDIELTIESTLADLDINTVRFFVNGVEVQASSYYGATEKEINLGFFSKRKIKYSTRRYGEEDVRYGQRDIYPSAFQYGYRYTCTIYVEDTDGLIFEESFSFTIEEGIFYSSIVESTYNQQTQAVANYLPDWTKARYDKYSNFQQLINPSCKFLQEVEDSLFKQTASYFVQSSNMNQLGTLYKVELGGDFEFQTTVLDDGTSLQIPPDVNAIKEITKYNPPVEFQNNIESFFYDKLPTRLDESKFSISDLVIKAKTLATDDLYLIDKDLERDGYLTIIIEDAVQFTQIKNNDFKFVFCRITGESREKKPQIEDLVIIDNDPYFTSKLWRKIDTIQFINLPDQANLHFTIDHARPLRAFVADSFSNIGGEDTDKTSFWKLEDTVYGSVLQQWVILEVNAEDIISSLGQKDLVMESELLDIDNTTNLNLIDIDVDKFNNLIYGIDNNYLYIFDKRESYPTIVKDLPPSNGSANFIINLDADQLGRGDTVKGITMNCVQKIIGETVAQYRLSIKRPDNITEYLLLDGTKTTDKDLGVNLGDETAVQLISSIFSYDLDIFGDYLIKLETIYKDGYSDIDAKIVRVNKKRALIKYKLERLLNDATISRMFTDFDQQLKILDSNNELHSIRFVRDNVLLDYSNSVLYFSEAYDEIEVNK